MDNCWSSFKKLVCCSNDGTTDDVHQSLQNPASGPPQSAQTGLPTLEDPIKVFKETADTWNIDALIQAIDQLLKFKLNPASTSTSHPPSGSTDQILASAIGSGAKFLKSLNEHTHKIDDKDDFFQSGQGQKVVEEILQLLGELHWIVGSLSIIAYLLNEVEKVSENRSECLQLLKCMFDLSNHIKKLEVQLLGEEENLRYAFVLIIEGCMTCASQLHSGGFFRFLKSYVDCQALNNLSSKINRQDLTLTPVIDKKKNQPSYLTVFKGVVGLEKPLEEVKKMVDLETTEVSPRVVVIYGVGGIGKTVLASALVVTLAEDLKKGYKYTKVEINEDPQKNDFKGMQQQILYDCFPTYQSRRQIFLSNCEEGRDRLAEAFNIETRRPVFIFIDNALRSKDLKELLPEDLRGLPHRSRILVTTRHLAVTDLFLDHNIQRHPYPVRPLDKEDALKILCPKDLTHLDQISKHLEKIVRIAGGIPLILKIVGGRLSKQNYKVENCSQILQALEDGRDAKEEDPTERLVHFVYKELKPSTQEALLDICFFFNGWSRRHVEYIVGLEEVTSLLESGLVISLPFFKSFYELRFKKIGLMGEDKLIVHDVIQGKGRSMGKSTRIEDLESLSTAAKYEVEAIKGVELRSAKDIVIEDSQLSCFSDSLRILKLGKDGEEENDIRINGCSSHAFKELRYLHVGRRIPCFPMNLEGLRSLSFYNGPLYEEFVRKLPQNLKYLKALGGSYSDVECPSLNEESIQDVGNSSVEELDLSRHSSLLLARTNHSVHLDWSKQGHMPAMLLDGGLRFDALKILSLANWVEMEELPSQVCCLPFLNKLILEDCMALKRLPEAIANLRALTHLSLRGCICLEEVCSSLGELTALRYLDFCGCFFSLRKLPDKFGQLSALEYLSLHGCYELEELPGNFAELTSLKALDLGSCKGLKGLPSNFEQLPSLEVLWIGGTHVRDKLSALFACKCKIVDS